MADGWKRKMISCLNEIFVVLISVLILLFKFLFCSILERKDDQSFKRYIIVLISVPIIFVSTSFLVNIGKEMPLPGFRMGRSLNVLYWIKTIALCFCSASKHLVRITVS